MRYRQKHKNKSHFSAWVMRTVAVVGCLTIISAYLLSNVYAKFSTSASGSDSARVAKFDVALTAVSIGSANMNGLTGEEKQTDIQNYDFSVTNNSEVSVAYDITVTFSKPLPEGVVPTVKLKDKANVPAKTVTDQKEFAFEADNFVFSSGKHTNEHTLTITVNYYDEDNNLRNVDLTDTEVRISVTAQQVD